MMLIQNSRIWCVMHYDIPSVEIAYMSHSQSEIPKTVIWKLQAHLQITVIANHQISLLHFLDFLMPIALGNVRPSATEVDPAVILPSFYVGCLLHRNPTQLPERAEDLMRRHGFEPGSLAWNTNDGSQKSSESKLIITRQMWASGW